MPLHDWSRVIPGTFHDFHSRWIARLTERLNAGLLPRGYYARAEQHFDRKIGDILGLHTSDPTARRTAPIPAEGTVAVLESPPQVQRTVRLGMQHHRRTLVVRHTSGHRVIALIEIVSPGNKSSTDNLTELARKVRQALNAGVHVVLLDLLPPEPHDLNGLHAVVSALRGDGPYELPTPSGRNFASYAADSDEVIAYLEHPELTQPLPSMPLFLTAENYVPLPLEETYQATFNGADSLARDVLEGRLPPEEIAT